ncbi:hypothetical protein SAMN05443549_10511 [Flavobacterium fluvii]|uniref:Uncharacterized protein n=1 Tax=Flavobacterium fluvii TaxID=468056 RepID=A0A1M5KYV5_9FLAO|nr:hypothetical protein [Flavobacterium fluvii]SHG57947.1 hypothetical protein SAMN05443549_10511 [Flavobacterium fluvii]
MKHKIDNVMETGKTNKTYIKHLISRISKTATKYCFLFKENAGFQLRQKLWSKKILAILFVLIFTIGNCMVTAHYLSSFSFELKNDMFSYLAFIILSIFAIIIINAKWIKIVAEKYADRF